MRRVIGADARVGVGVHACPCAIGVPQRRKHLRLGQRTGRTAKHGFAGRFTARRGLPHGHTERMHLQRQSVFFAVFRLGGIRKRVNGHALRRRGRLRLIFRKATQPVKTVKIRDLFPGDFGQPRKQRVLLQQQRIAFLPLPQRVIKRLQRRRVIAFGRFKTQKAGRRAHRCFACGAKVRERIQVRQRVGFDFHQRRRQKKLPELAVIGKSAARDRLYPFRHSVKRFCSCGRIKAQARLRLVEQHTVKRGKLRVFFVDRDRLQRTVTRQRRFRNRCQTAAQRKGLQIKTAIQRVRTDFRHRVGNHQFREMKAALQGVFAQRLQLCGQGKRAQKSSTIKRTRRDGGYRFRQRIAFRPSAAGILQQPCLRLVKQSAGRIDGKAGVFRRHLNVGQRTAACQCKGVDFGYTCGNLQRFERRAIRKRARAYAFHTRLQHHAQDLIGRIRPRVFRHLAAAEHAQRPVLRQRPLQRRTASAAVCFRSKNKRHRQKNHQYRKQNGSQGFETFHLLRLYSFVIYGVMTETLSTSSRLLKNVRISCVLN